MVVGSAIVATEIHVEAWNSENRINVEAWNSENRTTIKPDIPLLGKYAQLICTRYTISYQKDTFVFMFLDVLQIIAKKWNQPRLTIAY